MGGGEELLVVREGEVGLVSLGGCEVLVVMEGESELSSLRVKVAELEEKSDDGEVITMQEEAEMVLALVGGDEAKELMERTHNHKRYFMYRKGKQTFY